MNLHQVEFEDLLGVLHHAKLLDSWRTPADITVHVAEYAGNDVFIIVDPGFEHGIVIEADDAPYGGSIHEQARDAIRRGLL